MITHERSSVETLQEVIDRVAELKFRKISARAAADDAAVAASEAIKRRNRCRKTYKKLQIELLDAMSTEKLGAFSSPDLWDKILLKTDELLRKERAELDRKVRATRGGAA